MPGKLASLTVAAANARVTVRRKERVRMVADTPPVEQASPRKHDPYFDHFYGQEKLVGLEFQRYRDYVFSKLWLEKSDPEWIILLDMRVCRRTLEALIKIGAQVGNSLRRLPRFDERLEKTQFLRERVRDWIVIVQDVLTAGGEPSKDEQYRLRAIIGDLVNAIVQHREGVFDPEEPDPFPEDLELWAVLDKTCWRPLAGGKKLPIAQVVANDWWVSSDSGSQQDAAGSGAAPG